MRRSVSVLPAVCWNRGIATAAALVIAAGLAGTAHADSIPLTNGDFSQGWNGSQVPGWTLAYQLGEAGAYDANSNPTGSTGLNPYSQNGGTAVNYSPVGATTAGEFTMDAGDVYNPDWPGVPASSDSYINPTGNMSSPSMRISSANGDLGSFYQDTGVKFQPDTTYTLSAYVSGIGSGPNGFSNTGVGLSGGGLLTYAELNSTPGLASLGQNGSFTLETVTIDTANPSYSYLATDADDIVVNLLAQSAVTGGGRGQSFSDVNLTETADTPEPAIAALLIMAVLPLVLRRRSRAI